MKVLTIKDTETAVQAGSVRAQEGGSRAHRGCAIGKQAFQRAAIQRFATGECT